MIEEITELFSDFTVEINGHDVGGIKNIEITAQRECITDKSFGEGEKKNYPAAERYQVVLQRAVIPGCAEDFFPLKDFRLTITEKGCMVIYSNCQWVRMKDVYHIQQGCMQEITLISSCRRFIRGGFANGI